MAFLEETYLITADDESSSVSIKKDPLGNLDITVNELGGVESFKIPEELVSQFTYAINRLR